ncbi:MAG: glycosyltransferase [Bradyrhizobium sp.]|nr:MAG: glycosyltransferase [Bradyrhizobium sp.]
MPNANARPRTLLFYIHALVGGGAERVWARLASGFAARGDRVTFVVDFEASEALPFLSHDVALEVLPRGHGRATLALARILASRGPDVSLSALAAANLKHALAANWAGRGDRAILSYHGFFASEPERLSRIGYLATPFISRFTAASVAVSNVLRDDLVARFAVPRSRARAIANPAAPEPFPPPLTPSALALRPPTIVALGRLVPDKDFVTLLRAFARLERKDTRLVILGEGSERVRLEAEAKALGVTERVEAPGFSSDAGAWVGQARCLALSSRREAFGLVCVEGLAHGLPVVATACGGPAEIIDAPELGALVPVGDVVALTSALARALSEPGDPAPRQARARAFSLDAALDRYDALIEETISHARSPALA